MQKCATNSDKKFATNSDRKVQQIATKMCNKQRQQICNKIEAKNVQQIVTENVQQNRSKNTKHLKQCWLRKARPGVGERRERERGKRHSRSRKDAKMEEKIAPINCPNSRQIAPFQLYQYYCCEVAFIDGLQKNVHWGKPQKNVHWGKSTEKCALGKIHRKMCTGENPQKGISQSTF